MPSEDENRWLGRVVFDVSEPRRNPLPDKIHWRRLFRIVGIETDGEQIRFLLRNKWGEKWGAWQHNDWKGINDGATTKNLAASSEAEALLQA